MLVKGDSVMPGYRNLPEKNAETFDDDGWLADRRHRRARRGRLPEDRRPQEGADHQRRRQEHVAGQHRVEAEGGQPADRPGVAIGDRRPYNVALIVLDPDFAPVWAQQNGLEGKPIEELAAEEKLIAAIQEGVDEANAKMARVEQIKKFKMLPERLGSPGGDELTPTMKLKRKPIAEKYAERDRGALRGWTRHGAAPGRGLQQRRPRDALCLDASRSGSHTDPDWPGAASFAGGRRSKTFLDKFEDSWGSITYETAGEPQEVAEALLWPSRWVARGKSSGIDTEMDFSGVFTFEDGVFAQMDFFFSRDEAIEHARSLRPAAE